MREHLRRRTRPVDAPAHCTTHGAADEATRSLARRDQIGACDGAGTAWCIGRASRAGRTHCRTSCVADRPNRLVTGLPQCTRRARLASTANCRRSRHARQRSSNVRRAIAVPSPCHACRTNTPHHTGPTRSERGGACAHHRALNGEADEVGSCTAWLMASQAKPACVLRPPPGGWAVRVLRPSGLFVCVFGFQRCLRCWRRARSGSARSSRT